jgi:asparagine synthase (glutamine-hydrolysing)
MCGILGFVDSPWAASAERALEALASRGPDGTGLHRDGTVVLGHRRLAVIDLETGAQPMLTNDGRYTVVFNGEIYNFRDLRNQLAARGRAFATQSDTEVLLHGFAEWGRDLLPKLDGMFAFAIWDAHRRRLFAARDRLGIKPFFYSCAAGMTFASTLAAFSALDGFPRQIDLEALRDYLAFQTVLAPHSMLRNVRQLPPAHWLQYDAGKGGLETGNYWAIPAPRATSARGDELIAEMDAALARAVRRQLVADVPLGAFLSGGIDSSLIVHYMAAAGARPLKTFSVRFRESGFDESAHAQAVAEHYGTEHHVLDAPEIGPDAFSESLAALDQPLADPAYVPTYWLARLTRSHVTVALSGDGGDELFGGYARFRETEADHPRRWWQPPLARMIDLGVAPGALLRRSLWGRDLLFYRHVELGPYSTSRKSMRRYLSPGAWAACRPEATLEGWTQLVSSFGGRFDTASLMRADLWTYLSENCLVKTDRASMASSLEVRVPMLGNDVLDAVLDLPADVHFDPEGKALLRRLAQRYLPETVWNRPKHGFSVPLRAYLSGAWREIGDHWFDRAHELAPCLDAAAVGRLWRDARAGRGPVRLAYTLLVLLAWLERNPVDA